MAKNLPEVFATNPLTTFQDDDLFYLVRDSVDAGTTFADLETALGGGGSADAVLYTSQSLTSGQQLQARTNIGAAPSLGTAVLYVPSQYATLALALAARDTSVMTIIKMAAGDHVGYYAEAGSWAGGNVIVEGEGESSVNSAETAMAGGTRFTSSVGFNSNTGAVSIPNIGFRDFSVDCGDVSEVSDADCLDILGSTTYPVTNVFVENVSVLMRKTTPTTAHGIHLVGCDNWSITNCRAWRGVYGIALKATNGNLTGFTAYNPSSAGVIAKASETSADAFGPCHHNALSGIVVKGLSGGTTRGVIFENGAHDITLGGLSVVGVYQALWFNLTTDSEQNMRGITARGITGNGITNAGVSVTDGDSGFVIRDVWVIGATLRGTLAASSIGFNNEDVGSNGGADVNYVSVVADNFESGFLLASTGVGRLTDWTARGCTYAVNYYSGTVVLKEPVRYLPRVVSSVAWTRSGTTATVTSPIHELPTGSTINVTVSSDTDAITTGNKTITSTGTNTFTFTCLNGGAASGTITYSFGVESAGSGLGVVDVFATRNMLSSAIGSTAGDPADFGTSTANTAFVRFHTNYNISGLQGGGGKSATLYDYSGIVLQGGTNTTAPALIDAVTGIGVQVLNTTASSKALVIKGAAAQSALLLDVQDSSATTLASISAAGVISGVVENEASDTTCFPLFVTAATGSLAPKTNAGLAFNSATGLLDIVALNADSITADSVTATTLLGTLDQGGSTLTFAGNLNFGAAVTTSAAFVTSGTSGITLAAPSTGSPIIYTLPTTAATLARTDAAQTFTGTQTFGAIDATSIGATTRGTGLFTTLGANGAVTLTAGTASSSTTTGTLVVTGGIGLSGAIYIGGGVQVSAGQNIGDVSRGSLRWSGIGICTFNGANSLTGIIDLTVSGNVTLGSGSNIVLDTTTGTKIGTGTTQLLGFYNATPIAQGGSVADASGGAIIDAEARTAINALISRIEALGLIATV